MWFKNLRGYTIQTSLPKLTELEELLKKQILTAVGKVATETFGWVSPLSLSSDILLHSCNGYYLLCACKEERILPSAVVQEYLQEKVVEIESQENRKVSRKNKQKIKEEIIFTLLPKAFTRKIKTYAYIDMKNNYLFIDSSNANRAESVINLLRETLGSFIATPVQTNNSVGNELTNWVLNDDLPEQLTIESKCELIDTLQEGGSVKCNNQTVQSEEICQHIRCGKQIKELALTWKDNISFVLSNEFVLKQIKPLEVLVASRKDIQADTPIEQLDADFSLMTLEYSDLITDLLQLFGGQLKDSQELSLDQNTSNAA